MKHSIYHWVVRGRVATAWVGRAYSHQARELPLAVTISLGIKMVQE